MADCKSNEWRVNVSAEEDVRKGELGAAMRTWWKYQRRAGSRQPLNIQTVPGESRWAADAAACLSCRAAEAATLDLFRPPVV